MIATLDEKVVGSRIRGLRSEAGLNAADFGATIGVSENTVLNWETGNSSMSLKGAFSVASFFGVPLDYVCGRSDSRVFVG